MSLSWRFAFASVVGASHTKTNLPCQDASDCRVLMTQSDEPVLVAVVSDGAGSAERSEVGANLACALIMDEMTALFQTGGAVANITADFCRQWLVRFRREIAERAEAEGRSERDFACTVLAAVLGVESAAFFQIGDGAIVVHSTATPGDYGWMFWPEKGEYENQTYFATDASAANHLQYSFASHRIDEVAVFSDGLQRLALHMESQTAYAPFFRPMFTPLRSSVEGFSSELSDALIGFLTAPRMQDKTDDDTSLVLATRLPNAESR